MSNLMYQNLNREMASSERYRNRAYKLISEAMLKTVIQDGDLSFFRNDNPMKDIVLTLAKVNESYAYQLTLKSSREIRAKKIWKIKKWHDEDLAPLFNGELTIEEIAIITNLCKNTVYKRVYMHPDWKFKKLKGMTEKTAPRAELINRWLGLWEEKNV